MSSSIKLIKRRIKAAKNISQITKAMEMVAASKMRKSQSKAMASRPYADKLETILRRMSQMIDPEKHGLLIQPAPLEVNSVGLVVISPDKGLCGSLNSNLFKALEATEKRLSEQHADIVINFKYISIGKKAREYVLKTGRTLHAEFTELPDRPAFEVTIPISQLLLRGFISGDFYKVYLLYPNFINTLTQKPETTKLLPISAAELDLPATASPIPTGIGDNQQPTTDNYLFEPTSDTILEWLLPYYFELSVYQKILESQASEHSSRMVAMRNASDNAKEILRYLNLEYNRKRQASITNEIANLVTSRLAVGG